MPTKERLAQTLHAAGLLALEARARAGVYDDFESTVALPKVQLVADLRAAGMENLVERAIAGEWDSTKEEAEAWYGREGHRLLEEAPDQAGETA